MNRSETEALLRYRFGAIDGRWGQETLDSWTELLADTPELAARRALVELIREGRKPVSLSEIMERIGVYRRVARERAPSPVVDSGVVIDPREGIPTAMRDAAVELRRRGRTEAQIKAHLERIVPLLPGYQGVVT